MSEEEQYNMTNEHIMETNEENVMENEKVTYESLIENAPSLEALLKSTIMLANGEYEDRSLEMNHWGRKIECGTEFCFAGNVVFEAGFVPFDRTNEDMWAHIRVPGESVMLNTMSVAQEILKIKGYNEAEELFFAGNSNLIDKMIERWPTVMRNILS